MKMKIAASLIFALIVASVAVVYADHPWLGKTLSAENVKERWGAAPFDEQKFKQGDRAVRASMAYALMQSKNLMGLTSTEIRQRLGDFDGHYFSESYPTYIIQEASKKGEDTWQLVFLIDRQKKTKRVIVHKNCCD